MDEDLLQGWIVSDLPGAPNPDSLALAAAVGNVRSALGWHLAPEVTETLVVDSAGGCKLWLPTRHIVAVSAVRVMADDGTETPLAGWNPNTGWSTSGWLHCPAGFPAGERRIRVDLTHGYTKAPAEILAIISASLSPQVKSESVGSRSVAVFEPIGVGVSAAAILARYELGSRP